MIIPSSYDSPIQREGPQRNHQVVSLHEGGAHLTLRSRSRFVALRAPAPPSSTSRLRALSPPPPNAPSPPVACKTAKPPPHPGLPARGDVAKVLAASSPAPLQWWRAAKQSGPLTPFVLLRGVASPATATRGNPAAPSSPAPPPSPDPVPFAVDSPPHSRNAVPRIVVTPPRDAAPASSNVAPVPQNAAFGMRLTVPDPAQCIINLQHPSAPTPHHIRTEDICSLGSHSRNEADATDGDQRTGDHTLGDASPEDDVDDDVLDLGHTWSG